MTHHTLQVEFLKPIVQKWRAGKLAIKGVQHIEQIDIISLFKVKIRKILDDSVERFCARIGGSAEHKAEMREAKKAHMGYDSILDSLNSKVIAALDFIRNGCVKNGMPLDVTETLGACFITKGKRFISKPFYNLFAEAITERLMSQLESVLGNKGQEEPAAQRFQRELPKNFAAFRKAVAAIHASKPDAEEAKPALQPRDKICIAAICLYANRQVSVTISPAFVEHVEKKYLWNTLLQPNNKTAGYLNFGTTKNPIRSKQITEPTYEKLLRRTFEIDFNSKVKKSGKSDLKLPSYDDMLQFQNQNIKEVAETAHKLNGQSQGDGVRKAAVRGRA